MSLCRPTLNQLKSQTQSSQMPNLMAYRVVDEVECSGGVQQVDKWTLIAAVATYSTWRVCKIFWKNAATKGHLLEAETIKVLKIQTLLCPFSCSTGSDSCTWSASTATSRAIGAKEWRSSRMSHLKTPLMARDSSQRSESTSTGEWSMALWCSYPVRLCTCIDLGSPPGGGKVFFYVCLIVLLDRFMCGCKTISSV